MELLKIKKIRKLSEKKTVYDFGVKDAHHYIFENGVISHNSFFPSNTVGGGSGSLYASTTIIELGKSQDKEGKDIVGTFVRCKSLKNRLAKEKQVLKICIKFDTGLDPYSGLLELAEEHGILPKTSTGRYEWKGKKLTKKQAGAEDVMKEIIHDENFCAWLRAKFKYQSGPEEIIETLDVTPDEEDDRLDNALGALGEMATIAEKANTELNKE